MAPSSISILPKNGCSNSTRCWCCGLHFVEHLVDPERHAEAEIVEQRLGNPAFFGAFFRRFFRWAFRHDIPCGGTANPKIKWPLNAPQSPKAIPNFRALAAQQFVDADTLGGKRLAQHRNALVGIGRSAHEDVERRVADFRPSVDGDVALRQHRDAGDAARLEMMQMNMQQRRLGGFDAAPQRRFDVLDVVQALGAVQIDDQVDAGAAHAFADGEMIVARLDPPAPEPPLSAWPFCLPFGRYLGSPSPSPIARGRSGSCRPPQPEIRTRDAGEPAPRKAKAARSVHMTDQQRLNPHINANSDESRRFCKKSFNASSFLRSPPRFYSHLNSVVAMGGG